MTSDLISREAAVRVAEQEAAKRKAEQSEMGQFSDAMPFAAEMQALSIASALRSLPAAEQPVADGEVAYLITQVEIAADVIRNGEEPTSKFAKIISDDLGKAANLIRRLSADLEAARERIEQEAKWHDQEAAKHADLDPRAVEEEGHMSRLAVSIHDEAAIRLRGLLA